MAHNTRHTAHGIQHTTEQHSMSAPLLNTVSVQCVMCTALRVCVFCVQYIYSLCVFISVCVPSMRVLCVCVL